VYAVKGATVALGAMRGAARMVGDLKTAGVAGKGLICLVSSTSSQVCSFDMGVVHVLRACQTAKPVRARVFARSCLQLP